MKERIAETTEEMGRIRKQIRLCDGIEDRSKLMADELRKLSEEQTREEGKPNEQLFRGRGGTGRAYESGRG